MNQKEMKHEKTEATVCVSVSGVGNNERELILQQYLRLATAALISRRRDGLEATAGRASDGPRCDAL